MIVRSPFEPIAVPDAPLTSIVLRRVDEVPDRAALIDGPTGRTLTYRQLRTGIEAAARGFAARGLRKGDVVAIDAPNLPEYAVAFHGIARAGGVVTTVNPLYTAEELGPQLKDSGARFIVTIPQLVEKARTAAAASDVEEILVFGEAEGATPFATLLEGSGPPPDVATGPDDLVVLPYSSGTTGMPKGVMLTHRNLVANLEQFRAIEGLEEHEVVIGVLPFFHIYGMTCVMNSVLSMGGTVVTMPRFDLEEFLRLMQDHRVTRAYLVPPIILALAKHPAVDRYDLSALRHVTSGAAPLGKELQLACAARLSCQVRQGYGLTETSPVTHFNPADPSRQKAGTVGPLIPNTEMQIVELGTDRPLPAGEEGEIWLRGPQVMKGYLNNPEATARTLTRDGWLRTGDIGRVDENGYLSIVDRAKELIKYKGFQVAPAELEALLLSHPSIADAAVIASPDEEAGEVPKAFVVPRSDLTADEVMGYVAEHVAPYKKVRRVEFRDAIPKSASGKILRRVLIEEERAAVARDGAPPTRLDA